MNKRLSLEDRARQGSILLDERMPGWHERIVDELEMHDCYKCILGQVYGMYQNGCQALSIQGDTRPSYKYGFNLPGFMFNRSDEAIERLWARLADAWKKEIRNRKEVSSMNIGEEDEAIVVEPAEDPFAPDEMEDVPPSKVEEQEKELIPA